MTEAPTSISSNITNAPQSVIETPSLSNTTKDLFQAFTDINTSLDTVDATSDPPLRLAFQLTGSVITIYDVFDMALDTLRKLGPFRQTDQVVLGITTINAANLVVSTRDTYGVQ